MHPGATSYSIHRDGSPIVEGLADNQFNDTDVDVCTSYTYTVYAVDETPGGENTSEPATLMVFVPGVGC